MAKANLNDLQAFVTVARERSFTRAAAQLGLSRSALSHAMLALEARLGVRLLTRPTRSVSTTEAGTRLLDAVAARLDEIELELGSLSALRDRPAGTVRITAHDHAITTVLWPRLRPLLQDYPDVHIEFSVDYAFTDIAAHRFDAGVRVGNRVDKDMIAVRIAPDLRMAVAASPCYLASRPLPVTPPDSPNTVASTCGCPRTVACMPGTSRKRRGDQCAGGWTGHVQQHVPDASGGAGRHGLCFRAARHHAAAHRGRPAGAGVGGLVADVSGIPPVLRESQTGRACNVSGDRSIAVEGGLQATSKKLLA